MEALRKLERVQTMLSFMQTRGLSSNHQDSDRFLAHFLLFMVQPFSTLNMEKRRDLINEHISKISATILDEALHCVTEAGCQQIYDENPSQCYLENKSGLHLLEAKVDDMAKIGFDAMQRANSTLEDFCRSYFMFHGIDANKPQTIFKFLPVLSFVESYMYQLDIMNEKDLHASSMDTITSKSCPNKLNYICKEAANQSETEILHESSRVDLFDPLVCLLQCHELLTDRIRTELKFGAEYWMLERKLCHALTSKRKILIEDVMRAIHLKSFDYRVLNLLLYQLRGQQVNEIHMEFLSISEFLVEVSDDLFHYAQSMTGHQRSCRYDYEDDVMENSFNVLRMFVGVYGVSVAPSMLAKCISEAEEKYERLSKSLDPDLSLNYRRRCEEATKEGGTTSGHAYGTWNIPHVIADEESFRSQSIEPKQSKRTT